MKVIVAAFNYAAHNEAHNNPFNLPEEPVVFMKPDSAILKDGKPFFIPDFLGNIEFGVHLVAKVCRLGKCIPEQFAHRYYDELTVGVDFRATDLQRKCEQEGLPWDIASGFDSSAIIGKFIPKSENAFDNNIRFHLEVDGENVQTGETNNMLFYIDHIISYLSTLYTLKIGDLIFAGIPGKMTKATIDQHIQGYLNEEKLIDFHIR